MTRNPGNTTSNLRRSRFRGDQLHLVGFGRHARAMQMLRDRPDAWAVTLHPRHPSDGKSDCSLVNVQTYKNDLLIH